MSSDVLYKARAHARRECIWITFCVRTKMFRADECRYSDTTMDPDILGVAFSRNEQIPPKHYQCTIDGSRQPHEYCYNVREPPWGGLTPPSCYCVGLQGNPPQVRFCCCCCCFLGGNPPSHDKEVLLLCEGSFGQKSACGSRGDLAKLITCQKILAT